MVNRQPQHFDNQGHRKCSNLQIPLNAPSWLCYFWSLYKNFHVSVFITYQLFLNFIRQPDRIFQSHQACMAMPTLEQRPYSRKNTNWVCTQLEFSKNMILIQQNVEANVGAMFLLTAASAYTQHYSQRARKSHHQLQEHSTLPQVLQLLLIIIVRVNSQPILKWVNSNI